MEDAPHDQPHDQLPDESHEQPHDAAHEESPERTHPQLAELEQRIAWFLENPQYELCVVVEPESQSIVRFRIPLKSMRRFREPKLGRIMDVELTPDEAVREDVMLDIGFEPAGERKATWDGARNVPFPRFTKPAKKAKVATLDLLRVMEEVFQVGQAWLWTFHVDDPDQWPDPLPKPRPWPPVARPPKKKA